MNQLTKTRPPRPPGVQTTDRGRGAAGPTTVPARPACPPWAQALISALLAIHIAAVLVGALVTPPYSRFETFCVHHLRHYFGFFNQGYAYRYYSRLDTTVDPHDPRPWGTPIVVADLEFAGPDGATTAGTLRLPDLEKPWPRLRFQRQLDLAYHLANDPRWAASYARHIVRATGCRKVVLYSQNHNVPDVRAWRASAPEGAAGRAPLDLEAPGTYGPRVKLGEFTCDEF